MTIFTLLFLYISFRLKHFVCDFILQSDWMALNKGLSGKEGLRALLSHAGIHAVGTLVIMLFFALPLWWLCLVDFAIHGGIDRLQPFLRHVLRLLRVAPGPPRKRVERWPVGFA